MPKISGNELLQRIKKHEKLRKIPVLIFSFLPSLIETFTMRMTTMGTSWVMKDDNAEIVGPIIVETVEQFWIAVAKLPRVLR